MSSNRVTTVKFIRYDTDMPKVADKLSMAKFDLAKSFYDEM